MKTSIPATGIAGLLVIIAVAAHRAFAHDMAAMADGAARARTGAMGQMGSHMSMGPHMVMTESRPATPADLERAREIIDTLRTSIRKYKDYRVALANRYVPFLPSIPQEVYHFTNFRDAGEEYSGHFDLKHPGSLLYIKKGADDYGLIGAMYSAPPGTTHQELDQLIPLSIGTWHAHTDICLPDGITLNDLLRGDVGAGGPFIPGMIPASQNPRAEEINRQFGVFADGRFGFRGKIADDAQCNAAGGHFIKQAFGWMIHVYPFAGDDLKVAFSTDVPKGDDALAR
jgi:hypothetical protein